MSITTVQDIWLVIDHNHKEKQLAEKSERIKAAYHLDLKVWIDSRSTISATIFE